MTRRYAQSEPFGTRLYVGRAPRAKRERTRHQRAVDYVLSRMRWAGATDLAQLVMLNELERNYPKGAVYDVRIRSKGERKSARAAGAV